MHERHGGDQDRIWDYYQSEAADSFAGSRARIGHLFKRIGSRSPILNIGIGAGFLERLAVERAVDVYSLDPSARAVQRLRDELDLGERAMVGRAEDMAFPDGFFSAVIASELFEHLADDILDSTMREIHRVLRPGGVLIGTVPAEERMDSNMVLCPHCGELFHRWGHQRSFSAVSIRTLLSARFTVDELSRRTFVTFGALNWKGKLLGVVRLGLNKMGVPGENDNYIFVVSRP